MKDLKKLSRQEMKLVLGGKVPGDGGGTVCTITVSGPNRSNPITYSETFTGSCSSNVSRSASNWCDLMIDTPNNGVNHCSYNCGC